MNTSIPRRLVVAAAALALVAAGCSSNHACTNAASCATGEICYAGSCADALPAGSCTPPTNPVPATATLATGFQSDAQCRSSLPAPVVTNLSGAWLAPVSVDGAAAADHAAASVGQTVSFNVPAGTSSVTIHSQGVQAAPAFSYAGYILPNSTVPTALTAPNGDVVFDDLRHTPDDAWFQAAYYGGVTPWTGSFTFPDTWRFTDASLARGEVPPGRWSFRVNDWNQECAATPGCAPGSPSGRYDVTVVTRPGPYVSTGIVNVAIYVVSSTHSAAIDAAAPAFRRFVQGIGELLGRGGLCLGSVTFYDVSAAAKTEFSSVDVCGSAPCDDLSRLFAMADPGFDGVHLFLVDAITASTCGGSSGGVIVGIDGSIPGPSGLPGARTSGAAMMIDDITLGATPNQAGCTGAALDFANCPADFSAYVAAHEIGHWLGLYHTTESSGATFDPLPDTPACSCRTCGDHSCGSGTAMSPVDCPDSGTCGGGDNLMFWVFMRGHSQGKVSAQQGYVMRLNPAVR